ncbi:MAG TPA: hypothetical protein DCY86_18310 [Bdellovibrionales bacterium]|nr:hypothetical protein [Bdellovibrionales bacterium]
MNVKHMIVILVLAWSGHAFAQTSGSGSGSGQGVDFTSNAVVRSPSIIKRLLEHPQVRAAYDQCRQQQTGCGSGSGSSAGQIMGRNCQDELAQCAWGKLPQTTQGQIIEALNSLEGNSGDRAGSEFEKLDLGTVKSQSDRAFIPMREFFKKQLEDALYSDVRGASNNIVDQKVFIQIYETRVSKNLVEAITSFCIDIHPDVRKRTPRVYELGVGSGSGSTLEINRKAQSDLLGSGSDAGEAWKACASDIRNICTYLDTSGSSCPSQQVLANFGGSGSGSSSSPAANTLTQGTGSTQATACAKDESTQIAACKVEAAMKTARAALIMADELKTAFGSAFQGGSAYQGLANSKVYTGGGVSGEKSIDEISTLTSKNVETAYGAGAAAEAAKIAQACGAPSQIPGSGSGATSPVGGSSAAAFNASVCQRYVMTQEMALKAEADLSEYSLRSRAMQERMKTKLSNDPNGAELTKYLKETGMSESEIQGIKGDAAKKDKAVASILGSYEAQRLKIIQDMQERIQKNSATTATLDQSSASTAAANIQQELSSEPERYKRVTHYSNLITVFLQKGGAGSITFIRSAAAERELGNSAMDAATNTQIRNNLANQGLGGSANTAQQSLIKGQDLNSILIDLPRQ